NSALTSAWSAAADTCRDVAEEHELIKPAEQHAILLDLFGNPFRPVVLDPVWRTQTMTQIATTIYDERAFDHLPILADALEEAGCADAALLGHLRGPGPHVRGCWVVDQLLGKL